MVRQVTDTDGSNLTRQPADGASASNGPTPVTRGVAMSAMALAASAIVLYLALGWKWVGIIPPVALIMASMLTISESGGAFARRISGDTRERMARLPLKQRTIQGVSGIVLLVTSVVTLVALTADWSLAQGDTLTVIAFSLMAAALAAPAVLAPRLDGGSEGIER